MNQPKTLEKLIFPVKLSLFNKEYFEKKPLLISRKAPDYFKELLTIDDIHGYLKRNDILYPAIRLFKNGSELPQTDYLIKLPFVNDKIVDNDKLFDSFNKGATIVINTLHEVIPSLTALCKELENNFNFKLGTNAYLTPTSSQGFAAHYDGHDVFILQVYGKKKWSVYESPVYQPANPLEIRKLKPDEPTIKFELTAGDTLYIPRGFVHEAFTTESESLHITLGLMIYSWIDLLHILLDESAFIQEFRKTFDCSKQTDEEIKNNITKLMQILISDLTISEKGKRVFQSMAGAHFAHGSRP
jgi:ribosomal protein L16 Arg81 hydroxylase